MLSLILASLLTVPAKAEAPALKLENIKRIVCESIAYWEQDTPNEKSLARGVKIWAPGSRRDVHPRPGAFLLAEYQADAENGLTLFNDQQYYFDPIRDGILTFAFIADWKANGELSLGANDTANGWINQKTHMTDLQCVIERK